LALPNLATLLLLQHDKIELFKSLITAFQAVFPE